MHGRTPLQIGTQADNGVGLCLFLFTNCLKGRHKGKEGLFVWTTLCLEQEYEMDETASENYAIKKNLQKGVRKRRGLRSPLKSFIVKANKTYKSLGKMPLWQRRHLWTHP